MQGLTDVKQTVAITGTAQLQKYVGGSLVDITRARIKGVQAQSTAAGGSIKIYDTSGAATAAKIVFEAQFGTVDNSDFTYYVSEAGIKCDTGMYAVLSGIDFLVVIYS